MNYLIKALINRRSLQYGYYNILHEVICSLKHANSKNKAKKFDTRTSYVDSSHIMWTVYLLKRETNKK